VAFDNSESQSPQTHLPTIRPPCVLAVPTRVATALALRRRARARGPKGHSSSAEGLRKGESGGGAVGGGETRHGVESGQGGLGGQAILARGLVVLGGIVGSGGGAHGSTLPHGIFRSPPSTTNISHENLPASRLLNAL
jgi:hypothetical protein